MMMAKSKRLNPKISSKMGRITLLPLLIMGISSFLVRCASANLVISEFLASNSGNIKDEDGDYSDWLEIYNDDNSPVNLNGLALTDDQAVPNKWTFPSITIPPDDYLIVFCSSKNRINPLSALHTNFALGAGGEYLGLYNGGNVLSEYSPAFPPQSADRSYGVDSKGDIRYFSNPTPGAANGEGDDPVAATATASVDRGFYSSSFSVALSTQQQGGQIRYTLNGSEPTTSNGSIYNGPISITTTTILRAAVFANGVLPSPSSTWSYIFLQDVLKQPASISGFPNGAMRDTGRNQVPLDMEMDPQIINTYSNEILGSMTAIPTMSITAKMNDIFDVYLGEIEKKVSIEILHASNPNKNEQIDVGMESHSHNRLKRSLRLNFRTDYGKREWETNLLKNFPVNGNSVVTKHRTLILRAGNNRSWARDWNPDATAYTEDEFYRSTFTVMNGGRGSHGTFVHLYLNGVYWGVYNLVERPDDDWAATYFDGDDDDWFFTNHGGAGSADSTRWNYLVGSLAKEDMSNGQYYNEMKQYLDVSSFVDYLLVAFYIGLTDWPVNNWYVVLRNAGSPLGPTPAQFQAWDGEWSLDRRRSSGSGATIPSLFVSCSDTSTPIVKLWCSLRKSNDFMDLFADRVALHTAAGGALSKNAVLQRWDTLNNFIKSAIVGESARWGDSLETLGGLYATTRTRNADWQNEVNTIRSLLEGNTEQFIQALLNAGFITDLPDPPTTNPTFKIKQMHYHPADPTADELAAGFLDADEFEFIVLENVAGQSLDVANLVFDTGITVANLDPHMVSPGEEITLVANLAAFTYRYPGAQSQVVGEYEGSLSNGGEIIVAQYPLGNVIASFTYDDVAPWPLDADGFGPALYVVDIGGDLNDASNWIAAPALPPGSAPTAPTAPVAPPTAPIAPTAPVTPPTAPVTAPTAPVVSPTAPVTPPAGPPATSPGAPPPTLPFPFTQIALINSDTEQPIQSLKNGDMISPGNYTIDAITEGIVGSVQFLYNNSFKRNENQAPYAFCGNQGSDFKTCGEFLVVGPKTVTCTAYTLANGGGNIIGSVSLSFNVGLGNPVPTPVAPPITPPVSAPTKAPTPVAAPVSAPVATPVSAPIPTAPVAAPIPAPTSPIIGVTSLKLVNAYNDTIIQLIQNDMIVSISAVGGVPFNIMAETIGSPIGSVVFNYSSSISNGSSFIKTENVAPYAMCGDSGGNYNTCLSLVAGTHTVIAKAYSGSGGNGTPYNTLNVTFNLIA